MFSPYKFSYIFFFFQYIDKIDTASPRSDLSSPRPVEKADAAKTAEVKSKDDKKSRRNNSSF